MSGALTTAHAPRANATRPGITQHTDLTTSASVPASSSPKAPFMVKAHHSFQPTDPGQLPFRKGDMLEIVRMDVATGWAAARHPPAAKIGWIPRSFVAAYEAATTPPSSPASVPNPIQPRVKTSVVAVTDKPVSPGTQPHAQPTQPGRAASTTSSALGGRLRVQTHLKPQVLQPEPSSPLSDADALLRFSPSTVTSNHTRPQRAGAHAAKPRASTAHPFAAGFEFAAQEPEEPAYKPQSWDLFQPPADVRTVSVKATASASFISLHDTPSLALAGVITGRNRSRSTAATYPPPGSRIPSPSANRGGALEQWPSDHPQANLGSRTPRSSPATRSPIGETSRIPELAVLGPSRTHTQGAGSVTGTASSSSSSGRSRGESNTQYVTLSQLIDTLLREHNKPQCCEEISFCSIFFNTFQTFTTSELLFERLKYHYTRISANDLRMGKAALLQVVSVLRCWTTQHALAQEGSSVVSAVSSFLLAVDGPPPAVTMAKRSVLALQPTPRPGASPIATTVRATGAHPDIEEVLKLPPAVVAEHLTLYEHQLYSKVTAADCIAYSKAHNSPETSRILEFCGTSDRVAALVKQTTLIEPLASRVSAIEFWIRVAQRCVAVYNAASAASIVAALNSVDLSRLTRTWKSISPSSTQAFKLAKRYIDPAGNHRNMRLFLRDARDACVPFIGMYLRDLVHLHESLPESLAGQTSSSEPLINWNANRRLAVTVWQIRQHQTKPYSFVEDEHIMKLLTLEIDRASQSKEHDFYPRSENIRQLESSM